MKFLEILRKKLNELAEQRNAAAEELEAITATAEAEQRSELDPTETEAYEAAMGRVTELDTEIDAVRGRIAELEELDKRRQATAGMPPAPIPGIDSDDAYDVRGLSLMSPASEIRARALTAVERTTGDLDDDCRRRVTTLLERSDDTHGTLAKRILATGSDAYRSAFQKMAGGAGHLLNDDERQALVRAQSLTPAAGGFAVPFTLDPTIIYTGDGAANPFRQVADVQTIVTDTWNGVSSAGVTGGYKAEGAQVADNSATLGRESIKPERWDVFVPFSFEIGQDWQQLESELRRLINERRDEVDTVAFTTGSGNDEPEGFVTALIAAGGSAIVAPETAETFAAEDVYKVAEALPPRYRRTAAQAKWMLTFNTMNTIRQFAEADGHELLARLNAGFPPEILGFQTAENSAMRSASQINPAATAANPILAFGDWSNFKIVDRAGMAMELVPHLFGADNRPTGQRGFLAWGRTGSGVVNTNALRLLNVATTA
ncbi:MAG: phage major capsid protein [Acidimicrobiales bacterium]